MALRLGHSTQNTNEVGYAPTFSPMFRYRLRTLLIVLAIGPMVLAAGWFCVIRPFMVLREVHRQSDLPPSERTGRFAKP
jgi:hypothetical protein